MLGDVQLICDALLLTPKGTVSVRAELLEELRADSDLLYTKIEALAVAKTFLISSIVWKPWHVPRLHYKLCFEKSKCAN